MNRYGIPVQCKHIPQLDKEFMPILKFNRAFLADAKKPVSIAVERDRGQVAGDRAVQFRAMKHDE